MACVLAIARARPQAKSGRKFAIGQVFLVFIFAPTGNGLSFFRTATRSDFERCNTNSNPIINPIFYPIFHPIATRLPHIFICFQLIFHIPDPLQQKLSLDNIKRVLFCTNPEVNSEFFVYLTFWDTFDGSATANYTGISSKNTLFQWEKVANGLSGCTDNPHQIDPIKKGRPDNPFCPKFFRRPEVRTDKKLSGPSLSHCSPPVKIE